MKNEILNIIKNDPWLEPYSDIIKRRYHKTIDKEKELLKDVESLSEFASGYLFYGLQRYGNKWIFRESAPNASEIYLVGNFNHWKELPEYKLKNIGHGNWELILPTDRLHHKDLYKLSVYWDGGYGLRIPSYAKRVIQDEKTKVFNAQVWYHQESYQWKHKRIDYSSKTPIIYEAHIGMASEEEKIGTYDEFRKNVLPKIIKANYDTIQLMAIQEHPYYGSFGYHVANFFAASSRFGPPEDLKKLIDEAHDNGIGIIMDLVHSHSVKNEIEGLGNFDGNPSEYFHVGPRREHIAWDSLCFDYGKDKVIHFLLSNCKYWLEEFMFDGFRFDGVTSMLYYDHGLSRDFNHYNMYFDGGQDEDAITYLCIANKLIHHVNPGAITIAEEMSGMPGLAEPVEDGGVGFDYRLAMGIPDFWIKIIKEVSDENWNVSALFYELTSKRKEEKTVSYAESHDQALVGDKTIIFRLTDKEMYWFMNKDSQNLIIDRGIALHKMIRLITIATSGGSYLNFMGNEFGHPEWIDFPREGNNWSYKYAKRQWKLVEDKNLRYHYLADFDKDMVRLILEADILNNSFCGLLHNNNDDQVLAFERKGHLFVFNFNPVKSFTDYGINIPAGKFRIVLNTDSEKYGGFGLIDESLSYYTEKSGKLSSPEYLKLYLPSRTGLVLKRIAVHSIH
jgi:1,4-alpha-glucan branching enzyme